MSNKPDSMDDEEREIAKLLEADAAPTSDLHDARIRAAIKKSAQTITDRNASGTAGPSTGKRPWAAALAASLIAAMVVVFVAPWSDVDDDVVRSGNLGGDVYPVSDSVLVEPPERFSWPTQPAATGYRVVLRDNSGTSIWVGTSEQGEIELDPAIRDSLTPETSYIWSVTVDGGPRQELGPFWFQISN